jgi:hypothetical protein
MAVRTLTGWILSSGSEYKRKIIDRESRVRLVTEDSTDLSLGSGIGSLNAGEYYYDYDNEFIYIRCTDSGNPSTKTMKLHTYYHVFGAWATQTEMSNLEMFQAVKIPKDMYLRYIKIWIMRYNGATYTGLKLDIHPELDNYPTNKVIASPENTYSNADVSSSNNVLSEIWFRYSHVSMREDEKYCLVLKATGTFNANSHIAWAKLELVYTDGLTINRNLIGSGCYRHAIIGRDALV